MLSFPSIILFKVCCFSPDNNTLVVYCLIENTFLTVITNFLQSTASSSRKGYDNKLSTPNTDAISENCAPGQAESIPKGCTTSDEDTGASDRYKGD